MLNICITNLGKYNEGELVCKWVELPVSEEELSSVYKEIGIGEVDDFGCPYEEVFISDYECEYDLNIGEYSNINYLNDIAKKLNDLNENEQKVIVAFLEAGYSFDEAYQKFVDGSYCLYSDCVDMEDVAVRYVEENCSVDDWLKDYLDYRKLGESLESLSYYAFVDGSVIELY